jgi:hypothetical protein
MDPADPFVLTINGGSSSIKFALFEVGDSRRRILEGELERIGLPEATLRVKASNQADSSTRLVTAPDHTAAVGVLMEWIEEHSGRDALTAVGHRVVHGGQKYSQPQRVTAEMICSACGFWDTGLNPTQRWQQFEVASAEIGLASGSRAARSASWCCRFGGTVARPGAVPRWSQRSAPTAGFP